ncbi:MAG: shikimate dehydrogenase [Gemmatimonadaceae bacterium]|nr:shikimate dehydrogenase [Gemmatimonadaceae bacterium]NUQ93423.1 shikimate dehydrogenase [Gemmatimonadaceae bacterium]NUR20120.1 shikimate dehydrogenase [Gemmatimonadaceae bacterium]
MSRPARLVLLGSPVAHSLSPTFQNAALASAGLPLRYEAIDVAPSALGAVLGELAREGAAGNVTVPHKEAAFEHCSTRTEVADRVGAVNTFWTEDGALHGDNTDVAGFQRAVRALVGGPMPSRIAMIGAGGAAAAVCAAAEQGSASEVRIAARTMARAEALAARFPRVVGVYPAVDAALEDAALVVNATPLGLRADDAFPVAIERLPADVPVLDLVYGPDETQWVVAARAAGHPAADGLRMLVEQGALSFERWFGFAPDREAMARAIASCTGRRL